MAVTFPDCILNDPELLELFRAYSRRNRRIYLHTQFNHPREIRDPKDAGRFFKRRLDEDAGWLDELHA